MKATAITTGVAVVRGVGGRRGAADRRRLCRRDVWPVDEMASTHAVDALVAWRVRMFVMEERGYRERRRLAKLRRRARDRTVLHTICGASLSPGSRWYARNPAARARVDEPWWATAEGRRRWLEQDRERKLERRNHPCDACGRQTTRGRCTCGNVVALGEDITAQRELAPGDWLQRLADELHARGVA